ncbi:MAG: AFG1/ZapE family ATPase, partial [Methylocella sp.]
MRHRRAMALLDVYHARIAEGSLRADARQAEAAARLSALADGLQETGNGFLARLFQPSTALRGIYLYGAVGRGKTMLMDLFFASLKVQAKRRIHFHAFMQDIHKRRQALKDGDVMAQIAKDLSKQAQVLCLDEMQIS